MKLPAMPKHIKVGAATYRVIRLKKGSPQLVDDSGDSLHGKCEFNDLIIYVQSKLPRPKAQEVLHHETNHACTYPSLCWKTMSDEEFVDGISPMSLQVMRDNPELMDYLKS